MKAAVTIFSLSLVFGTKAVSQKDSLRQQPLTLKASAFYHSHLNYYGRTDSLRSAGFFAVMELWFTPEIYINASPVFVNNSASSFQYAGTIITTGYLQSENSWGSHVYFSKPIYGKDILLLQSALKAQLTGTFTRRTEFLNFTAGADIKWSDQFDYGAMGMIDHTFKIQTQGGLMVVFNPMITVNAGTQHFTKTHYKNNGFLLFHGLPQQVTEEVRKIKILSYELSAPIVVAKGRLQFITNPAFVIPQNLITVPDRPSLSERGRKLFYITIGVKLTL